MTPRHSPTLPTAHCVRLKHLKYAGETRARKRNGVTSKSHSACGPPSRSSDAPSGRRTLAAHPLSPLDDAAARTLEFQPRFHNFGGKIGSLWRLFLAHELLGGAHHMLGGGVRPPQRLHHMLGGGSRPPQRLHHMLGGGWGVERRAPPSLEAMSACSIALPALPCRLPRQGRARFYTLAQPSFPSH